MNTNDLIPLTLDEIKKIEIDILRYIDKICEAHHLNYYITAGTLIGAVRHHGFIPWDDDIDIVMMREDYRRLIEIMQHDNSKYALLSPYYSCNYYYPFCKVVDTTTKLIENGTVEMDGMGVYIDIFPLDKLPNDYKLRRKIQRKCMFYRRIMGRARVWKAGTSKRSLLYKGLCLGCDIYGWHHAFQKFDELSTSYERSQRPLYLTNLTDCGDTYYCVPASCFKSKTKLEFEGEQFYAMAGYDAYLRSGFKDYMKLPPIEKRKQTHNFKAFKITEKQAFEK